MSEKYYKHSGNCIQILRWVQISLNFLERFIEQRESEGKDINEPVFSFFVFQ